MNLNSGNCSSKFLMEELKRRIKSKYGSQDNFAKVFGCSRKTLSRLLNHSGEFYAIIEMCKLLDVSEITIK